METLIAPQAPARQPLVPRRAPLGKHRTGSVLAIVLAVWHAAWSALVAAGFAQPVLDFVLRLHFLSVPIQVQAFELGRAAGLVAFAAAAGYALGWLFAFAWDYRV